MGALLAWQEWQWHAIAESRGQTIDRLARENAKLRELCRDMLKTIQVMDEEWHSLTDFTTMAEAAETYDFEAKNAPEYEEKLRELGVDG